MLLFLPAVPCTLGFNPDLPRGHIKGGGLDQLGLGSPECSEVKHLMADFWDSLGVGGCVKIRAYARALHPTTGVSLLVLLVGRKMLRSKRGLRGSEGAGEISLPCPHS